MDFDTCNHRLTDVYMARGDHASRASTDEILRTDGLPLPGLLLTLSRKSSEIQDPVSRGSACAHSYTEDTHSAIFPVVSAFEIPRYAYRWRSTYTHIPSLARPLLCVL